MIEAEAALRAGETGQAEAIVDSLLSDPDQEANPLLASNPSLDLDAFAFDGFTGQLEEDLRRLARARVAGLWLTGTRQGLLRRLESRDGLDLYPEDTEGDATCVPIPEEERDNNPSL